jgi:hypothetical protein
MKTTLALVAFTLLIPVAASAQDGRLDLSFLDRLAARAAEKQEVTIGPELLMSSGPALIAPGPKAEAAKQIVSELKGIYVRSYEFDDDKAYSMEDINAIRKQLSAPGWVKIVSNEQKDKGGQWELQEVYFFQPGGKINGVFLINAEPGELQVVNIVGPIDFAKLASLAGILGIPNIASTVH